MHITLKSGFLPPTSHTPHVVLWRRENMLSGYSHVGRRWDWMNYTVTWKKWLHKTRRHMREEEMWRSSISWGQDTVINLPPQFLIHYPSIECPSETLRNLCQMQFVVQDSEVIPFEEVTEVCCHVANMWSAQSVDLTQILRVVGRVLQFCHQCTIDIEH